MRRDTRRCDLIIVVSGAGGTPGLARMLRPASMLRGLGRAAKYRRGLESRRRRG